MRIQILILGFKGLSKLLNGISHPLQSTLALCTPRYSRQLLPRKKRTFESDEKEKKSLLGLQTLLVGSREHNFMFRYEGRLD